jgi:tight adherence protein C
MIPWLAPVLTGGLALALAATILLYHVQARAERLSARLRLVRRNCGMTEPDGTEGLPDPLSIVTAIGEAIARSGALSSRTLEELRQTLHVAGFHGRQGLGLFVGAKLVLTIGLPLAVLTIPLLLHRDLPYPGAMLALAAAVGLLAPDRIVQSLRKRYLRALESGMPDALDLMVICAQAGLGLEASIERVSAEIRYAHPEVADELTRAAHEMAVNADVRSALANLGRRTGLDCMRRLGGVLIQSMQYGTPLTQALRALAAEQRQDLLARFEARAARLPVLLTLPMIIFILPCVFLIVAGPAMIDVYRALAK